MSGKVLVLLSTYNGEEYLRDQLESLLHQDYEDMDILIRDDGSTDDTVVTLKEYQFLNSNVQVIEGTNIGLKASFYELLKKGSEREDVEYFAFCDQDDVWDEGKISRAVAALSGQLDDQVGEEIYVNAPDHEMDYSEPILYCSRTQLTDADLNPIPDRTHSGRVHPAFANALIENIVVGCTMVMNRRMARLAIKYEPEYCIMHDWWFYLVSTALGRVMYDSRSYLLYRQHRGNVMGIDGKKSTELKNRISLFGSRRGNISRQAGELVRLMDKNLSDDGRIHKDWGRCLHPGHARRCYERAQMLAEYKEGKERFEMLKGHQVFRQRKGDEAVMKLLFLAKLR